MPIIPTPPIQGSPPPISSVYLRDFTGGINFAADDLQLPLNQFPEALDVDIDVKGGFYRRDSFRSMLTTGLVTNGRPKFLYHIPTVGAKGDVLVGGQTTTPDDALAVWRDTDVADASAKTHLRTFTTDSTQDRLWSGAQMNKVTALSDQILYIHRDWLSLVQGYKPDGTLTAELADAYGAYNDDFAAPDVTPKMPKASIMCAHSLYLFHADCYENSRRMETRLRWSHPGQPGNYRTNDYIDVGEGQDNDQITALVSAQGRLFIFKSKSVWVLDGYSAETFSITKIGDGVGAVNKNAAVATVDGVAFFDAIMGVQKIKASSRTWSIEDMWQNISKQLRDRKLTNGSAVCMASVGPKIVVSGLIWDGATNPNRTFVYDSTVGPGWWVYSVGFELLACFTGAAGRRYIMGAAPFTNEGGASTTYRDFVAIQTALTLVSPVLADRFNGTTTVNYTGYMFCPWVDANDPARKKRFRRFSLTFDSMATNKSFTVNAYRNWSVDIPPVRTFTVTGLGTATPGISGQQNNVRGGALGTAYSAALKITGPNDVAWGVNQVTFRFVPKRIT